MSERQTADGSVPGDIRANLSPEQVARLEMLLSLRRRAHGLDYRFSTTLLGRRFYFAILGGSETRALRRLREEGVLRAFHAVAVELAVVILAAALTICLLTGIAVVGIYLTKVALGIDVLDGPSSLHPIYEWLRS